MNNDLRKQLDKDSWLFNENALPITMLEWQRREGFKHRDSGGKDSALDRSMCLLILVLH